MPTVRMLVAGAALLGAAILQVSVVSRLPFPAGEPQLLVVLVVACALAGGAAAGALTGFAAGLLADLVPPADSPVGRAAFVLCIVGYAVGLLRVEASRSALLPILVVAVATVVAVTANAFVGTLLGEPHSTVSAALHDLPATVAYDVLLAPFVVPVVGVVARRLTRPVGRV